MLLRLFLAVLVAMLVARLLRGLFALLSGGRRRSADRFGSSDAGRRRRGLDPRGRVETTWSEVEDEEEPRDD